MLRRANGLLAPFYAAALLLCLGTLSQALLYFGGRASGRATPAAMLLAASASALLVVGIAARLFRVEVPWSHARRVSWKGAFLGALAGALLVLPAGFALDVVLLAWERASSCDDCPRYFLRAAASDSTAHLWTSVLAACCVSPVTEELLFRHIARAGVRAHAGPWCTIALCALGFALCHGTWATFFQALVVGCFFGWLRERRGSLAPALMAHVGFNSASLAINLLFPMSTQSAFPERAALLPWPSVLACASLFLLLTWWLGRPRETSSAKFTTATPGP